MLVLEMFRGDLPQEYEQLKAASTLIANLNLFH